MIPLDSRTRILDAARGKDVDRTPVWFMRQAGRIFPEYREIRDEYDFMTVCRTPELSARVTLMPLEQLPVDAAIIFSDLMVPVIAMGIEFEMVSGTGPVMKEPLRSPDQVEALEAGEPETQLDFVYEAIRLTRGDLDPGVPLIGFAGAPFTLACYLIEGQPSRNFTRAKQFMFSHPDAWARLMETLSEVVTRYLVSQVESGADLIQLFDTWAGGLAPAHYREFVLPYVRSIMEVVGRSGVPRIYFSTQSAGLLPHLEHTGADVLSVDWRLDLLDVHRRLSRTMPLQGNLDPSLMLTSFDRIKPDLDEILTQARVLPGHLFNLGHGVLASTPLDTLKRVIHYVHSVTETDQIASTE